jgi:hypothetical protein
MTTMVGEGPSLFLSSLSFFLFQTRSSVIKALFIHSSIYNPLLYMCLYLGVGHAQVLLGNPLEHVHHVFPNLLEEDEQERCIEHRLHDLG